MKKILLVSIGSFLFLSVSSIVGYLLRYLPFGGPKPPLFIGIGILVSAVVFAIFSAEDFRSEKIQMPFSMRTPWNIFCFLLSAVALGFCIRAWYLFRKFDNELWVMLLVSLSCVAYLWVYYLLLYLPFIERHVTAYTFTYVALSLIGYILVAALTKTTYVSTFGYYMIVEIAFLFALCMQTDSVRELIRVLTLSSFSVFIVAIILLLMICGGDGIDLDGSIFDGFGGGMESPKKKRVHK